MVAGFVSATRTGNVGVAGFYPGIILCFGSFLGIVGINLIENRKPMLQAAVIFISMGVIASFFSAMLDGVIASEFIDTRPLLNGRCQYFGSEPGYASYNFYEEVTCQSVNTKCEMKVKSNTCYCCDLYNCDSPDTFSQYYAFTEVTGCNDVIHLQRLLWACCVLNVLGLFLGIITAAILGAYKDLTPAHQMASSPPPPPHILYNPTQHVVTYAGFCPNGQPLPAYPNYPALPMQNVSHSSCQSQSSSSQAGLEMTPPEGNQSQPHSQDPSQPPCLTGTQDPTQSYTLTPNEPNLYPGLVYRPSDFEKPPPYAC
ncbi:hypothetical protein UPYG_G00017090 [Umbra pygmaea]|uniref:Transmembrane protein 255B n=1 Tax=Umbra pygmaea TaxID=75934 RepID=A0ABD0XK20_UMBPY